MRNGAAILLATYNGERFISRLLASLAVQAHRDCVIYWQDDGSTDATVKLVEQASLPFEVIRLRSSNRLGPAQNFLHLLRAAAGHHGSYHFADQDDIWHPDKVSRGHHAVSVVATPTLFHTRQVLIDADDRRIALSRSPGPAAFENAVVENIVVGCSSAINDSAARLVAAGNPTHAIMHDWWAYLVVSCFGQIKFEQSPTISYRQHAGNLIGSPRGTIAGLHLKALRQMKRGLMAPPFLAQATDLAMIHGELLSKERHFLIAALAQAKLDLRGRIRAALKLRVHRQSLLDQMLLRVALLTGRY